MAPNKHILKLHKSLLLLTTYNVGDIIGKQLTAWRCTYNYTSAMVVVVLRSGFFFFYLLISAQSGGSFINSTFFAFANTLLYAISNGYATAALMTIGPELTDDPKKKEIVGFINGFALTFGISCGTFLAIAFQNSQTWLW